MSKETLKTAPDVDLLPSMAHEGDHSEAVLVSSPTSKAGKFWQYLHTEREFSAAYFNALLENDMKAVTDALDILDMSIDYDGLTKEEYGAFMRGRTPSGELELTSWGGYYETEPLANGEVFALLIFSGDNRIFWGPVEGFFEKTWSKHAVRYQLTPDAKLSFSSAGGDVVLSFSRTYDEEDPGTVSKSSFVGTLKGVPVSGTQTAAPLLDDGTRTRIASTNPTTHDTHTTSFNNDDPTPTDDAGSESITVMDYIKYAGLAFSAAVIVIGLCKMFWPWCPAPARRLSTAVSNQASRFQAWKLRRMMRNEINLEHELEPLKEKVEQQLNDTLLEIDVDYDKMDVDTIIKEHDLKKVASDALNEAVKESVALTVKLFEGYEIGDLPKSLEQDAKPKLKQAGKIVTEKRVASVMQHFSPESEGAQALTEATVLTSRKEFYNTHAENLNREHESALQDVNDAKDKQQRLDLDLRKTKWEIERLEKERPLPEDKIKEARDRQAALEKDIDDAEKDVIDKEKVATEVERDKRNAEAKRDQRDLEERREKAEEEAKRRMEEGLRK